MTFEEKRALMFSVFDGVDEDGDPFGGVCETNNPDW